MKQILTIMSDEGSLVDLLVESYEELPKTMGIWALDNNKIILGRDRWDEWNEISGNNIKQKKFMDSLTKMSKKMLGYEVDESNRVSEKDWFCASAVFSFKCKGQCKDCEVIEMDFDKIDNAD